MIFKAYYRDIFVDKLPIKLKLQGGILSLLSSYICSFLTVASEHSKPAYMHVCRALTSHQAVVYLSDYSLYQNSSGYRIIAGINCIAYELMSSWVV